MRSNPNSTHTGVAAYADRIKRIRRMRAFIFMAAVVVFCTVYALILPAVTMEADTVCGLEEHEHTGDCYTESAVLVCEVPEHTHSEDCYEQQLFLICTEPEREAHTHDESCYQEVTEPVCGLEESEDHQHTEECFETHTELICGLDETEGHTHGDTCYELRSVLVCGIEEHEHGDECYEMTASLTCGKEEHIHTEECFAGDDDIADAGQDAETAGDTDDDPETETETETDTNTDIDDGVDGANDDIPCTEVEEPERRVSDPTADVESAAVWMSSFSHIELTGNWAEDVIAIAETQLGYRESTLNFILAGDGSEKGYTRYGAWYGVPYGDWCAMFASFCIRSAGVEDFPIHSNCGTWIELLSEADAYREAEEYAPSPGDLVFFDYGPDGNVDHVGIVTGITQEDAGLFLCTIEGNLGDRVTRASYEMDDPSIMGYGVLPENPEQEAAEDEVFTLAADTDISVSTVTESGITVTVSGPAEAFPAEADALSLEAVELSGTDGELDAMAEFGRIDDLLSGEGLQASAVWLFDIRLLADGVEAEPLGSVSVSFEGLGGVSSAYHLSDEVTEVPVEQSDDGGVILDTDHFSIYGLVAAEERTRDTRSDTTSLSVSKVWSDAWLDHDPVTISLMYTDENGVTTPTGQTLTLSADNGWKGVFDGLQLPDGGGFPYSVVEDPVANYITEYREIEPTSPQTGSYWVPASSGAPTGGGTYVFSTTYSFYGGTNTYVMNSTGGASPAGTAVTPGGQIEIDGTTYASHLTGVPATAAFRAVPSGSGFLLMNVANDQYLNGNTFTAQQSGATPFTLENGRLRCGRGYLYLNYAWGSGLVFGLTNQSGSASVFSLYELVDSGYETSVKNTGIHAQQGIIDPDPQLHKTIDYLGDGGENPDTDLTGSDYYRLYLDVIGSHQPVDLLIVADMSNSMANSYSGGMSRRAALDKIVNGTILQGSGATAVRDDDGIIFNFLSLHPENKVAVTGFSGGYEQVGQTYEDTKDLHNPITMYWTSKEEMPNGGETPRDCYARVVKSNEPGGTNYTAALMRAGEMLLDPTVTDDGHMKVMIFLTDGEPNRIIDEDGVIRREEGSAHTYTRDFFLEFIETHPNLIPYIIGISPDANSGNAYTLLSGIADDGHMTYFPANDVGSLQAALKTIIDRSKFSLVQICDELSANVEYYSEQADLKVTRKDASGTETVIWENGGPTEYNFDDDGNRILQCVVYTDSSGGTSTGSAKLTFNPDCLLDGENTFVLSYNVKITDEAKEQFVASGYDAEGDEGTDYGSNETSSGMPGFFANDNAYVTYTAYDVGYVTEYPHPVVQVDAVRIRVSKVSASDGRALSGAGFNLYRQCPADTEGAVLISGLADEYGTKVNPETLFTSEQGLTGAVTLLNGRYYLIETEAPAGYYPPGQPMVFDINEGVVTMVQGDSYSQNAAVTGTGDDGVITLTVENNTSHHLPDTGGSGTGPYVSAGLLLITFAFIYGYTAHTRGRRNDGNAS